MIEAETLTKALGGRWSGSQGTAKCPAHDDSNPSLSIRVGDNGRPLLHCFCGCPSQRVVDALIHRGLWEGKAGDYQPPTPAELRKIREEAEADKRRKIAYARDIWRQCQAIANTPAERYLRERGLRGPFPDTLRYVPGLKHRPTGQLFPALVAAVAIWPSREVSGIHRTFIRADGMGKAPISDNKMMVGPCRGGAVRLAPAADKMAIAEGLETALTIQQETGLPTWAALSTSGLTGLIVPDGAVKISIYADHDKSRRPDGSEFNPGLEAAQKAAAQWRCLEKEVEIFMPPEPKTDFNDVMRGAA